MSLTVDEVKESIKRWVETDFLNDSRENLAEYNKKVDSDEERYRYYTKKKEFNPDTYRSVGLEKFVTEYVTYRSVQLDIGMAEPVVEERHNSEIYVVFKINDEYFKVSTDYDSWNDTEWTYAWWEKVEPVEVTVTHWETV